MPRQTTRNKKSQNNRAAYKARRTSAVAPPAVGAANGQGVSVATATTPPKDFGAPMFSMDREREYAFIRSDIKRMIVTAGLLLALMIALLFVIEQ